MHTGSLKKWALALTFWLALHLSPLKAQIFTNDLPLQAVTTGSNPVDFEFRSDGTLIAKGNLGVGSLGTSDQGDGTRMLWFPALGAFRAGSIDSSNSFGENPWDAPEIGEYSVAFGLNSTASGYSSTASGYGGTASGYCSTTFGLRSVASGSSATAIGGTTTASGARSFAEGTSSTATGNESVALGLFSTASAQSAVAMGALSTASGEYSTASGYGTTASGYSSSASGYRTTAAASFSFTIGTWNVGGGNPTSWVTTDPIFEIGNGTESTPSDALVVYKNGNVAAQGVITSAPGGDIPMYTGE